ncbi:hypothetical protein GTV32_02735 [Gordonia sp. SID5947]|uniref:hypothetical protein n=1 Tax=Gordonia sp. SID5947 TaxID=2690315 RepID=UPI001368474D|nr:hypothetical protein [Gordonia sp. SID5947]MYR05301.1 hypothetical protein [Gordonia sp. SID5947]
MTCKHHRGVYVDARTEIAPMEIVLNGNRIATAELPVDPDDFAASVAEGLRAVADELDEMDLD